MSYSAFIHKFENGDSAIIPFDELQKILSRYGKIEVGNDGLEFVSNVGDMFEYATLDGTLTEGISGMSFHRPTLHEKFPLLIFDLLELKNTCFFGEDMGFFCSRYDMKKEFPEEMIKETPPTIIFNATKIHTFLNEE